MMRIIQIAILTLTMLAGTHKISSVESNGSWVYMYDESGHKYKTLSAGSVGEVKGFSAAFFVSQNGGWVYLFDAEGKKYKVLSYSSVGDVTGVSGETFTSRNGGWIYTWNKDGKKINTRAAR
ncbi:MAG: VCBS domain-containing protein [Bacteroidales bacterium]|nr:VCBS domain-containing protein [Bacteroidales bacterium]